ncbi:MAG TPA: molybdopterin-dependent oxidoreductase [Thermodesulfobacteriota bacterium]|nr:molybdopterin-dependent oxidoreductase [Thermodesulfobacteriota bacterium]
MPDQLTIVRSACRSCHGVCQVLVHLRADRVVKVSGDPDSPTSRGYLCPKGSAAPELLYHPDRLTHPLRRAGKRGENRWKKISWEEALSEMTDKLTQIKRESGAEYVAIGQGTGRPHTEWTARFAHAYGTPNFIGPAHICYLPRVVASGLTLGRLPVSDIYGFGGKKPACILIWGCNLTYSGAADGMCGGMLQKALNEAEKVIVVDPRRIGPAETADHWLQLRPGTDGALALAMINTIVGEDLVDHDFVDNYATGFDKLVDHVRHFTPEWAEPITGVKASEIRAAARTYANHSPACLQWGNGIDMSVCSFHTGRSLLILMGITGNIDQPGGNVLWVPPTKVKPKSILINHDQMGERFLPPGQKKRMIGAGKFPFCPNTHTPTFWDSVISGQPYRVRGLWIIGSNPLVTATQGAKIERSLKEYVEFTVVSDLFMTPTARLADLVLPAVTWLEQDDVVFFHKIWCVIARKKLAQIGESRDDRDVIFEMGRRLGLFEAFPWRNSAEYLDWLLEDTGLNFERFCQRDILLGEMRYRKYESEGFQTPSGKFEISSRVMEAMGVSPMPLFREPPLSPVSTPELTKQFPLLLISGTKVRNFFHSEYRQIKSLRQGNPDPLVEIHPDTATSFGIGEGDWVWIETPAGRVKMKAKLFDGIRRDVVNAQHGWWFPEEETSEYAWKRSNVNLLYDHIHFDPENGSEPLKSYLCKISKT